MINSGIDERSAYEILSVVSEIPEGRVASYGQIARLIGRDKNARLVGRALSFGSSRNTGKERLLREGGAPGITASSAGYRCS